LEEIKESGLYKHERIITTPQRASINTLNSKEPVLNFCANNYLGLSDNKQLIEAAKKHLDSHGLGLSSVRFICGTQDIHKELERKIADFHETEDSILYGSCFDANAGVFEALLTPEDAVISDTLNHASIIDGIRLCKAQKYRFQHLDMKDLEDKLKETKSCKARLIVTDGAFSMDGDIAPLDKICNLAEKYDAAVFVDDCHATGFLGKRGRGTPEYHNVIKRVTIVNSTLGKALGGATGGYTTGPQVVVDLLRQRSRPYLFSNSLAPSLVGAYIAAFDLLSSSTDLRDRLAENTRRFRNGLSTAGLKVLGDANHPIAPIWLGDAKLATDFANEMLKKGIYVIGFSFPVVPKGQARIRVQLSAAHTSEQIDRAVQTFIDVGKQLGVIQ